MFMVHMQRILDFLLSKSSQSNESNSRVNESLVNDLAYS